MKGRSFVDRRWIPTDEFADCSVANQVGVIDGQIVIWEGIDHAAAVKLDGAWQDLPRRQCRASKAAEESGRWWQALGDRWVRLGAVRPRGNELDRTFRALDDWQ